MNATICEEVARTTAVEHYSTQRTLLSAPTVVFITDQPQLWAGLDENGRRHRLCQVEYARHRTGRSVATGQRTIGIAVRRRPNGLVRFDADLFRLDYELSADAIGRLYCHWHDLNADHYLTKRVLRRMVCHFGKTTIIFDAGAEQADEWREFLTALLSDAGSYTSIRQRCCIEGKENAA